MKGYLWEANGVPIPPVNEWRRFRKQPVEVVAWRNDSGQEIIVPTPEGVMTCAPGDWLVRGTRGEYYPCKPGPFADTYEPVGE